MVTTRMANQLFPELEKRNRLKKYLRGLYPNLKSRDFKRKLTIDVKDNVRLKRFLFFRTFIPYFFDLLHRLKVDSGFPDLSSVESVMGWCVGDAHLENFGTIWRQTQQGEIRIDFTMNDPDDGGPCPLYADLLRFLTGTLIYRPSQPALPIINAYRQGLEGDMQFSYLVKKRLKKAKKNGAAPDIPKELTKKCRLKPKKNKRFEIKKSIPNKIKKDLTREIRKLLDDGYKISRLWGAKKLSGGSGGIQRYRALLEPKKGNNRTLELDKAAEEKFLVLELKKLGKPGIYPLVCQTPLAMKSVTAPACSDKPPFIRHRIHETLHMERDGIVSRYCSVVKVKRNGPMLTRALWKGNNGVKLKDISNPDELSQWIEDEAKIMGRLHRRYLPAGSGYPEDIQGCASPLIEAAEQLARLVEKAGRLAG